MPSAPKWVFDVFDKLFASQLPTSTVTAVEYLSKAVKKIRIEGAYDTLDFKTGYFIDFRISDTQIRRYTVSQASPQTGILEIIAHLHGDAPGSQYMDKLNVGDQLRINAPRGHDYYDESAKHYVLFGDETSLGLANTFVPLFTGNKQKYQLYFELDEENMHVPSRLGLENCQIFPKGSLFSSSELVLDLPLLQSTEWQEATFVLTGNVKSIQIFRKAIKARTSGKIHAQGYWIAGKKGL
ncbi:FAD-binding oxidoreductase [Sphingobacterium sp. LRF_L2]|uniref:FAD-binding oxidoreductase n=1 Tax=Sphingobacterium sp. LRF_L2 TaxID=3369421 RepID=UPI003F642FB0